MNLTRHPSHRPIYLPVYLPAYLYAAAMLLLIGVFMDPQAFAQSRSGFEYNAIVHVSWWYNEYNNFDQPAGAATDSRNALAATGANWAGVLVTQYMANGSSNTIAPEPSGQKTPTDASLIFAIQDLHSKGIKVLLKPHVDCVDGTWRGQITPSSLDAWFASYTQFIVKYAQLAQQQGVEGFCMGTEFVTLSGAANRTRWLAVINAIRAVYSGMLTYAANATYPADEFTSVSFWPELDVIGLDAYFTLTNQNNPTPAQLVAAWSSNANGENIVAAVQNLATSRNKPLIFTELGYKSVDGANTRPWDFGLSGAQDLAEQRDCYEAAFTVWSQRSSWMRGIFWWAWPVPAPASSDTDYNPRGKPAAETLRSWQGPPINNPDNPDFALSMSATALAVNRGASGAATIDVARSGGFTGSVALSIGGLPAGVTAAFNPATVTGAGSTLTLTASSTAATGTANVIITGTGGGLTHTIPLAITVNADAGGGAVTITAAVTSSSLWFNEEVIRVSNTANITALSITISLQRAGGISYSGQYNTVGGQIQQGNSSTAAAITYQYTLAPGQMLSPGTNRLFAAQSSGTGMAHPVAGDTYTVTYTVGGVAFSQTGHF